MPPLTPPPKIKLSRLRDIGWSLWDPIGLLEPGKNWEDKDCANFADEYDRYLVSAAGQLRRGTSDADVVKYLVQVEADHMGLGVRPDSHTRAHSVVAAINADGLMWSYPDAVQAMIDQATSNPRKRVDDNDVERWAGSLTNANFYNDTSLKIATIYHNGLLPHGVCDAILNDLWRAALSGLAQSDQFEIPSLFYDIYEAFDAGEYHRKEDRSDDPVADFTDPMISELLRLHSQQVTS